MDNQLSLYTEHLFDNVDEPKFLALPDLIRNRCMRIRSVYVEANDFPYRKDAELVRNLMTRYKSLSRTQAYEDLKIAKTILGNVHGATKEYHTWMVNQMIMDTYRAAVAAGDNQARVKAADLYGKYNRVGVEDEAIIDWSRMPQQPFTITFDPSGIGLKPIPNVRKYIDEVYNEFAKGDIVDVDYEEVDVNYDPFKRIEQDGGAPIED